MKSIYLNTAATGLVKQKYIDQASKNYSNLTENASVYAEKWMTEEIPVLKSFISDRFKANETDIALIPNFSYGINAMLNALPENSNILCYKKDYPSLIDPLEHKGFNVFHFDDTDGFEIYTETIERELKKHFVDFLLISHVQWRSGFKIDLKEISELCKRYHVRMVLDATQSAGAIEINFEETGIDVILFSNYKWMNAGFGSGIMLMKSEFLAEFPPKISGMHSYITIDGKLQLKPNIKYYEPGHQNLFGLDILKQCLENRSKEDIQLIESENLRKTNYFIQNFQSNKLKLVGTTNLVNRSSLFYLDGDERFHQYLFKNQVISSFREGWTRLSFHQENTFEEIDKTLQIISKY